MSTINANFHYGKAMSPEKLLPWSLTASKAIVEAAEERNLIPLLVYRGMSGVAAATAIAMVLQESMVTFAQVYIRKEHERSHGNKVQVSRNIRGLTSFDRGPRFGVGEMFPIFVDDIISSGETFRLTKEGLSNVKTPDFTYQESDWVIVLQSTWQESHGGAKVICGYIG